LLWLPFPAIASDTGGNPVDTFVSSAVTTVLGYGLLGILVVVLCVLFYKRWRLISPAQEDRIRDAARKEGRADLLARIERLEADCEQLRDQRDEAQKFVRDQLMPLLVNFTATTQTLLPILQQAIAVASAGLWPRHRGDPD
jgi:hypothetical protein